MPVFIKEIDTSSSEVFLLNTTVYKLMLLQFILLYSQWKLKSFSWHESVLQLVLFFPLGHASISLHTMISYRCSLHFLEPEIKNSCV